MEFDLLDRISEPVPTYSGIGDFEEKERRRLFELMERVGLVAPEKNGILTELKQGAHGAAIDTLRGIGSTLEETTGYPGMREYFDEVKARNRHLDPYAGYKAASLDPVNIARTIGSGAAQSGLSMAAGIATTALTGGNAFAGGAVMTGTMFMQLYGDRVKDYRERMPEQDEGTVKGLAFASALGESLIESVCGPEAAFNGLAKKLVTGALKDTTKSFVKHVGKEAAKNFITEGSEEVVQDMWDRVCLRAGTENVELPSWDEVKETFMGGAWSGLALGGIGGAVENIASRKANGQGKTREVLPAAENRTAQPAQMQTEATEPAAPAVPPSPAEGMPAGAAAVPETDAVNPGQETETFDPEKAKSTSARLVEEVAKEFGLKVRYFDEEGAPSSVDDKGNPVNGWYDEKSNEYWIDRNDPEMDPLETLGHEFKHFLDQKHSDLVKVFDELLKSGMNEEGKRALAETEEDYRQGGYPAGQGEFEFSADTFGKMWTDPEFWRDVAERAEKRNAGLGQKMLDALQEFIKIVRAKLKNIGTPEAKELFDNMGELRSEAARIMVEIKRRNGSSTEAENVVGVKGTDMVQSIPVADLSIDPARFQFKSKANKVTGVDESNQLGGEWDPKTAGNLYVWEDKTGKKFVVNGHHRFQLAKNSRVPAVNAIIDREADGVTAEQARRNGVLINIRDEQGDVKDYADFVRQEDMSEETAEKEGILAREKGRRGYTIGKYASDNLYGIFKADEISEAKAETIADIARKDEGLEGAGIRAAKTMPNAQLREFLKCLKNMPREKNVQGDLFGFDDSAIQMSEKLSKLAAKHIREIADKLKAVRQAVKNPETAAKGDVKVGKNAQKIYDQTLHEQLEWEHWYTNPELSAQLRKEAGIEESEERTGSTNTDGETDKKGEVRSVPQETHEAEKPVVKENLTTSGRFNMDSDTPLLTPEEDAQDFQLFDETPEEIRAREAKEAREEEKKIEQAKEEARKASPDLDFSVPAEKKQDADTIIRGTAPGSVARIKAFLELPDGEHSVDGKKFTKNGNVFERDGQKLSTRGIEQSFRDVPKRESYESKNPAEENKENIYLKMPIERVRQDAENGVKLAQDALKILEKQTEKDYINDKENSNASSTSTHLERGGQIRDAENTADAAPLRDDGRRDSRISGQGRRSDGSAGIRTETDPGNADASAQPDGTRSRGMDGGTLSGDRTGTADHPQSSGGVENSQRGIRAGDDADGRDADNHPAEETPRKPKSQEEADRVKVIPRDRKNIAETLPTLFPEQCDDVYKAEQRYSQGKGMLFTNATGTGKTFTGLGIIKRFVRQGKGNILIVTPTDKKNRDWANDAKRVNLTVTPLSGTQDNGGNGIAVTTYANFRQNESLQRRNWDLLVFDESHKISSAEGKIDTLAKQQLDRLGGVKNIPFRRAFEENKAMLRTELGRIDPDYLKYDLDRTPEGKNPVLSVRDVEKHWASLPQSVRNILKNREAELSRSKVLFLSATPFSYHNSLLYADGYLFDIPEKKSHGYNDPDGVQDFFITNFGYRMRYNKLTKPDSDVDVGVMERAFYEKMRKSGAVSGRMLEIDRDYSREFFRVQSDLGEKIQAGMDMLMGSRQYPTISFYIHKLYDYNYVTSLLECLKSKATVEEIQKDLAAGRKVVVFHNRNTGTPPHPFRLGSLYNYVENERQHQELKKEIERFETEHPELVNLRLNDLQNPLLYFRKIFGDKALFFDGTVPAKKRAMNVEEFNDAKSGKNLIVVQIEAGKEGISLHDTKGDAQRVLYNLGLPTKPTDLIQSEGRIYRLGSKSNAIFRYPVTGLPMERYAFGSKINQRASTAENLGMGDAARNLRDALREGYMNAGESLPFDRQGIGGKEEDRGYDAASDYDRAKTFYFGQQKRTSKNKSAEGIDYFATPEPIGYKMVEWAHLNPGDKVLEPSAGHGAIARFFPDTVDAKAIEPSNDLSSKLTVNTTAQVIRGRFEDHNAVNKYDCVLMNPPFGVGGKTAIEHLAKAFDRHLNFFGRVIAIIPEGGMADRRFSAWLNNTEDAHLTAEIGLPQIAFQRAGTSVKTKIVVIDKADSYNAKYLPDPQQRIDISAENINELFDRLEHIEMPQRGSFHSNRSYSLKRAELNDEADDGKTEVESPYHQKPFEKVRSQTIGTKTWMCAPNGKHTNLNEEQWCTVHTAEFKQYFGDWESAALFDNAKKAWHDDNFTFTYNFLPSERLKNKLESLFMHPVKTLQIDGGTVRHTKNHHGKGEETRGQINQTADDIVTLPYLINNYDVAFLDPKHDDNKGDRSVTILKRVNGVSVIGTLERGKAGVYVVTKWEKIKTSAALMSQAPELNVRNDADILKIQQEIEKIKRRAEEFRGIVDENGEPLVVYHGTDWDALSEPKGKAAFDRAKIGENFIQSEGGFFFTDSKDTAENYGSNVLKSYLSIKNPLVVKSPSGVTAIEFYDRQRADLLSNARSGNYDGIIVDGTDYDIPKYRHKLYVAFDPGQIKSATDNIGTFDPQNPDIRYSLKRHRQVNPIREVGNAQSQHQTRIDEPYETRSNAAVNEQAQRRIIGMGGFGETIKMMLDGDFAIGTDVSQRVLQLVLNSDEFKKLNADARAKISDLYIRDAGTEIARSLAARRLGVLKADDIKSIQAHINAFLAKIDKKKPHNDLRKQILDEFGYDIDNLPEEVANDPDKLDAIIRKMMAERATIFDKAYEFWINSILSGIPTHLANTMGNTFNAAYELGVKRLAEAAINVAARRKDGATFGEFKEMCRAVDWKGAFERAERSFRLETLTNTGKLDQARTAIGGKLGRAIRYPSRLLRAADEFAKAIVQPVEAAAYAYREGTANKLKGEDLKTYIATQIQLEGSTANEFGHKRAQELTFQEEPGKAVEQLIRWREAGGVFGTLLKFELPFLKTPANILRQGVRKSPLGAVNLAWQTGKALAGKRNFDGQYISLVAEQLLAWGCVAMLAGGFDDDDDKPFLTGTSPSYGSAEQKFKANKLPPYSIRIGDHYYSYKRIEPLATGLAFIADGLNAYRRAKRGEDGTRIMKRLISGVKQLVVEKSFLDSLGEINRVVSDPERSFMQSVTNFASSWMPNVVRQTANLWDDNVRDNKSRSKGFDWLEDQFQITTNRMGITRGAPKLDYFGREIKKDSLADSGPLWPLMRLVPIQSISPDENMNRAENLIWRYNQDHPDEEYYPDVPAFYFRREGKKLYMTGEDYQEFARKSGELALKQINNAFRHGLLHENNPTKKDIDLIKKIFARARKEVRDEMYRKHMYSE